MHHYASTVNNFRQLFQTSNAYFTSVKCALAIEIIDILKLRIVFESARGQ
jgi:hypothetical protein